MGVPVKPVMGCLTLHPNLISTTVSSTESEEESFVYIFNKSLIYDYSLV